jgi:hypothetical protein
VEDKSDFSEDDDIFARLDNQADRDAFSNLMAHAHNLGLSAADFVRQEPKRTSRKHISKLCLENQKRTFKMMVFSVLKSLWDRPANDQAENLAQSLYGYPQNLDKPQVNGQARKDARE